MALSAQAQLDMLADRSLQAVGGSPARDVPGRAPGTRRHLPSRMDQFSHRAQHRLMLKAGVSEFLAAIAEARRRGELDLLPRLYANLTYMMTYDRRYPDLFTYLEEGIAAAVARDNAPLEGYMRGARALAFLDLGRMAEALAEAEGVVHGPYPRGTGRFNAHVALARLRIRTGAPEDGVLDERARCPPRGRDIMRLAPLAVVDAEALWLGLPRPEALRRLRTAFDMCARVQAQGWNLSETALWLALLGEPPPLPAGDRRGRLKSPYREQMPVNGGRPPPPGAALGCTYEQALALSGGR